MYKKIVNNVLLSILVFFGFNIFVNASSIYDYLKSGDIIIGNTTFRNGTWISATRASKAGSLYTMVNGDIDVKTYKYINQNVWYEMDPVTDKYKILSKDKIEDLNKSLHINFLNNEPITKTYKSYANYEDDVLVEANDVFRFFNSFDGEIFVDESEVTLDYQNQTITCEFNTIFEFRVISNDSEDFYTGFCGDEFNFLPQEEGGEEPEPDNTILHIVSSKLAEGDEFLNQDNITLTTNDNSVDGGEIYYPANYINFTINEKFERFSLEDEYLVEGKYLVFDFEIDDNHYTEEINDVISYEENYEYEILDEHNFRLYVEVDDRYDGYQQYFLLNWNHEYITISLNYEGIELSDKDFELLNIKPAHIDVEGNNQSLIDDIKYDEEVYIDDEGYEYKDKYYNIYTIGDLDYFDYNDYYGYWLAFELEFDSDVYLDEIEINANDDTRYYYEIVEDKILLWIDAKSFDYGSSIGFHYLYTNGRNSEYIEFRVNNYYEDMSINYDKEILGLYNESSTDEDGVFEPIPLSWYDHNALYYKADAQKLYYLSDTYYYENTIIFRDSESFKAFHVVEGEISIDELVAVLYTINSDGEMYPYSYYANSDVDSLNLLSDFTPEEGYEYKLYYFFNREKTSEESEILTNLQRTDLQGIVELEDLSDYYYGEAQE